MPEASMPEASVMRRPEASMPEASIAGGVHLPYKNHQSLDRDVIIDSYQPKDRSFQNQQNQS